MRRRVFLFSVCIFSSSIFAVTNPQSYPIQLSDNVIAPNNYINMVFNPDLEQGFTYQVKCQITNNENDDPLMIESHSSVGLSNFLIDGESSALNNVNLYIKNKGTHNFEMNMRYNDPTNFIVEFKNYSDESVEISNCVAYT